MMPFLLLPLRPCCCSWRRLEARARERAPASWGTRESEEKRKKRERERGSPLREERAREQERALPNSLEGNYESQPSLLLRLTFHLPLYFFVPFCRTAQHSTACSLIQMMTALLPATPNAALPRRSQQQRSGSLSLFPSCCSLSRSRASIFGSDGRRRRFSSSSCLLSSSALRAAPADGTVVCLGEGLFGKSRARDREKRRASREREKEKRRAFDSMEKPRSRKKTQARPSPSSPPPPQKK